MDKKKIGVFFGLIVSFLSSVSAYTTGSYSGNSLWSFSGPRDFMERGIDFFTNLFGPIIFALLGGTTWTGEFLFEKLLILIMLIGLIFVILGKAVPLFKDGENSKVKWIIAIIIPLLAVRNLEPSWLNGIILQNAVLAVVLSSFLPFLIFFFFIINVGEGSHTIRMIGWIFFIIIYIGMWSTSNLDIAGYYLLTAFVALLALLFDNTIQKYFLKEQLKSANSESVQDHIAILDAERERIFNSTSIPEPHKSQRLKIIDKKIKKLQKQL